MTKEEPGTAGWQNNNYEEARRESEGSDSCWSGSEGELPVIIVPLTVDRVVRAEVQQQDSEGAAAAGAVAAVQGIDIIT